MTLLGALGVCTWTNAPVSDLGGAGLPAGRRDRGRGRGRRGPRCTVVRLLGHLTKGVLGALETPQRELDEGDKLMKGKHRFEDGAEAGGGSQANTLPL